MLRIHSMAATLLATLTMSIALSGGAHAQPAAGVASAASTVARDSVASTPAVGAAAVDEVASAPTSRPASHFHVRPVDDAWRRGLPRDADAATQAYLDRLPADVVARSNAYFEGGYWLVLWDWLVGLVVAWILLRGGMSARVRDWCQRIGRRGVLRDALFGGFWAAATWLLTLPMTIYESFVREHQYEMATQSFGPWFVEQLVTLGVGVVTAAIGIAVLYAVIRRAGERWWIWGTVATLAFVTFASALSPVLIDPLFNTYKPVADVAVRNAVLQMAQADGVPVDNVYEFDASRQTTRVSANVSGLFGTAAVRLNDNLMRTSLPEIRAVMGHELGHFVMNHIYKFLFEFAILIFFGFMFAKWAMTRMLARYGARWALAGVADVASFPLFMAVFATFLFLATPILNTMTRTQEIEADRFGLNLAREPHGMAEAFLKLVEYRKADPTPLEEFVFFDHPSAHNRIHDAMRWRQAMGTP